MLRSFTCSDLFVQTPLLNRHPMQLVFVPVEDFYFALTLCAKTLEEITDEALVQTAKTLLSGQFGQSSTVASARQNTFNYVFRVSGLDNGPAPQLVVSISDWQDKLRLSSDFGWMLDEERKPTRTDKFQLRSEFTVQLKQHLQEIAQIPFA
jgi:hypothetical protein